MKPVSVTINPDLLQCVQVFRSTFLTSKDERFNNMSRSRAIEILLMIALNSKVDPKDPRMDAIRTFLEKGKVYKDRRWYEDLARQIMRGLR